jgi:hypothetical protein
MVAGRSGTWSPSASDRPRPTPGRWPGTGRVISCSFGARPSAVATLVDRATRYAMVVALKCGPHPATRFPATTK